MVLTFSQQDEKGKYKDAYNKLIDAHLGKTEISDHRVICALSSAGSCRDLVAVLTCGSLRLTITCSSALNPALYCRSEDIMPLMTPHRLWV